jgi:poly-gamma-glutamate synthesis protein (capsule biosynthesis protein)
VKDYISSADIAIGNLEVTLAGAPYTGFPQFSSHQSLAYALQDAGFDVLLTANNHTLDRGKLGMERTLDVLDSIGMTHTGTFRDSAELKADYPLIVEKNNFRFALLNYTYGTNGIAVEKPNVVNYIDTVRMAADIAKAQHLKPDYIITCIHWGEEYKNKENATQRKIAAFLARHGCNLIVGGHPHVVQPLAMLPASGRDSVPVAYSLGNFISNQRERYRNGGITLDLTLTKTDSIVTLHSIGYEPFWVYRFPVNRVSVFRLIRINDYIEHPERYPAISETDKKTMMQFYDDTRIIMGN